MAIKLGVVGLSKNGGWASTALIPPILSKPLSDSYTLTAVSTSSAASASATASHYSDLTKREVKGYHGSTEAISADPDVDLVVVSVRVYLHLDATLPAIKAGKDVFVEWPLGKNLEEAKILTEAAQEKGIRTIIGLQHWQVPAFIKAKEWIDAGKIGRVISTSWTSLKSADIGVGAPFVASVYDYTADPEKGATFFDILIAHNLSSITRTLGKLHKVSATTVNGFKEIKIANAFDAEDALTVSSNRPDQWSISGVFESGALFSGTWLQLGKALPSGQPALIWEIVGTEGKIRLEITGLVPAVQPPATIFLNGERVDVTAENEAGSPTGRAWEAFASNKKGDYPTFEDALYLHKLLEVIRKSDTEGRSVTVDEV